MYARNGEHEIKVPSASARTVRTISGPIAKLMVRMIRCHGPGSARLADWVANLSGAARAGRAHPDKLPPETSPVFGYFGKGVCSVAYRRPLRTSIR